MAEIRAGTPSWVDLATPDVDASTRFYGDLFGWEADAPGPPEETGGYQIFRKDGKMVAGVGPLMAEGQPPAWTSYVATDDADETARRTDAAGGTVVMAPFDVVDAGRMAILQDPTGAVFGIWQAGRHSGAELFNEPGSLTWNELRTRDADTAKRFYSEVFGWNADDRHMGGGMTYTAFYNSERGIAGGMQMDDRWSAELPPHWGVYFAVDDAGATVARAQELGAAVQVPPTDIPQGRMAMLADPQGATFAIIQPSEAARDAARSPSGLMPSG